MAFTCPVSAKPSSFFSEFHPELTFVNADPEAARAARLLGIDYADALTGFEFRGRHGTAVIRGVVVANGYQEAVEAVIRGFADEQQAEEEKRRSLAALRLWRRFLTALRIRKHVQGVEVEGEDVKKEREEDLPVVLDHQDEVPPGGVEEDMESEEYFDDGEGGGFFPD